MAYSKHKMIEYHGDGGLGAALRAGSGGWSTRDQHIGRCGMKARHARAHGSVGSTRAWGQRRTHNRWRTGLVGSVRWLSGLGDGHIGPSP
jgi:hypothetical protein